MVDAFASAWSQRDSASRDVQKVADELMGGLTLMPLLKP